jgi:hypothetical protein
MGKIAVFDAGSAVPRSGCRDSLNKKVVLTGHSLLCARDCNREFVSCSTGPGQSLPNGRQGVSTKAVEMPMKDFKCYEVYMRFALSRHRSTCRFGPCWFTCANAA